MCRDKQRSLRLMLAQWRGIMQCLQRFYSVCIGDRYLIIFFIYDLKNCYLLAASSFIFDISRRITTFFRASFGVYLGGAKVTSLLKFRVLTSCLTSLVNCLSPWARQNFPALLKIEQTLKTQFTIEISMAALCCSASG